MSSESSVGRNSLIMASGTLASRITGQVRTILLAGALGVTGIAADAYQVGSQMPQVIFNLLAGGLLNAILVPQIVKAFKKHDYSSRINKLLTLSVALLLGFTLVLMVATPLLVRIYVNEGWSAPQRALANAFTLWCMPQIFFYGLYTVLGQVLAAKDRFGAYAWSSVAANVVSCAGFGLFIVMFGNTKGQPLDFWTPDKVGLTAGMWTLGVALQALILVIPLTRLGIKLKPEFGFRGIGLRSMGQIALWTLGMVLLDQLVGIYTTRITTGAPIATGDALGTAGSQVYMQAYQIWILPYSLITVSLATAIFPRLSRAINEKRIGDARTDLSSSLRSSGTIMLFFTAAFIAIPIPIISSLLPSVGVNDAQLMSIALLGLAIGLLPSSVALLLNRTFFAFEDGRSPFFVAVAQNGLQATMMLIGNFVIDPHYWVAIPGVAIGLSNAIIMPLRYLLVRRRMGGRIGGRAILVTYTKATIAAVITTFVGLGVSRVSEAMIGAELHSEAAHLNWGQALFISAVTGIIMLVVYLGILKVLKVPEAAAMISSVTRRFTKRGEAAATPQKPPTPRIAQSTEKSGVQAARTTQSAVRMASISEPGSVHMNPAIGDTINNRYTLIALYRSEPGLTAWLANDHTLMRDCQLFIVSDTSKMAKVNAIASSLALSKDRHFTPVLSLSKQSGVSVIVTETDPGTSLRDYLSRRNRTLSTAAIRTITGEIANAADSLRKVSLNHQAISTATVRVSSTAVTLADATVSPLLTTPVKPNTFHDSDEMLAVRQIAAVMFEMVTGVAFDPKDPLAARADFDAAGDDVPAEFASICTRALGFTRSGSSTPAVPIFTLAELLALLGEWTAPVDLGTSDLNLPSKQGDASIESVTFAPVEPRHLVDIPAALTAVSATDAQAAAVAGQSPWDANQLLFDGSEAVEEVDAQSSNFFSVFEGGQPGDSTGTGTFGVASTGDNLPSVTAKGASSQSPEGPGEPDNAGEAEDSDVSGVSEVSEPGENFVDTNLGEVTSVMQPLPPSFVPQKLPASAEDSDTPAPGTASSSREDDAGSRAAGGRKFLGRNIALIVAAVVLVGALIWAIFSLGVTSNAGHGDNAGASWNLDPSSAPNPNGTSTPPDGETTENPTVTEPETADKDAQKVPDPAIPNVDTSNPLPIASTSVIRNAEGLEGVGIHLRLASPQPVQRVDITARTGGGQASLYVDSDATNPNNGKALASFSFESDQKPTEVTLPKAATTQDIVIWVTEQPPNGFFYSQITVY